MAIGVTITLQDFQTTDGTPQTHLVLDDVTGDVGLDSIRTNHGLVFFVVINTSLAPPFLTQEVRPIYPLATKWGSWVDPYTPPATSATIGPGDFTGHDPGFPPPDVSTLSFDYTFPLALSGNAAFWAWRVEIEPAGKASLDPQALGHTGLIDPGEL